MKKWHLGNQKLAATFFLPLTNRLSLLVAVGLERDSNQFEASFCIIHKFWYGRTSRS